METELETLDEALTDLLDRAVVTLAEPMRDVLRVAESRPRKRPKADPIALRAVNDHVMLDDKKRACKKLIKKYARKGGPGDEYVWALTKLDLALDEVMSLALRRLTKLRGGMLTAEELRDA